MAVAAVSIREGRGQRIVLGLAAAVLVIIAWRLPVWQARLTAPQFPPPLGPLRLTAYGHGVEGDIEQVNQLNHYVGMQAFSDATHPRSPCGGRWCCWRSSPSCWPRSCPGPTRWPAWGRSACG